MSVNNYHYSSPNDLQDFVCAICLGDDPNGAVEHDKEGSKHKVHDECLLRWIGTSHSVDCPSCKEPTDPNPIFSERVTIEYNSDTKLFDLHWKGAPEFIVTSDESDSDESQIGDQANPLYNLLCSWVEPFAPHLYESSYENDSEGVDQSESEDEFEIESDPDATTEGVQGAGNQEFLGYSLEEENGYEENSSDKSAHIYNLINVFLAPVFALQAAFLPLT